jgi:hypothetical protein
MSGTYKIKPVKEVSKHPGQGPSPKQGGGKKVGKPMDLSGKGPKGPQMRPGRERKR